MEVKIECINCAQEMKFATMTKQALKQTTKQAFNWKVMLGLQKVEWVPTCEGCGTEGKGNFCCPKCKSKEIWSEDILKGGKLMHKC